ncbi:hypothetical protein [Epilithonimonas xixisoli]|uniref:Virion morphogenesis family protein n=1 Tax=Epilithonimonas xixisoli TaxID=1476462 RepID=A0A4R8I849_9FLAO|nr:hypothetical protein [Epilithonimonas xixisoli]TDX86192.1 hypothetical protein B0I22_0302 [Epilithonimonas xixisoli]
MKPEDFSKEVQKKANELKAYAENQFPRKAGNIALRFVNGNFRAQGFQGSSFKKWKSTKRGGTILVKSGKLRAGTYYTTQPGQATVKNHLPYAKAHNEGFSGTVTVKTHTRNKYSKAKVGTGKFTKTGKERQKTMTMKSGQSTVKSHSRKVNLAQRQFAPTASNPSPVMNKAIIREVANDINLIMKK